MTDQRKPVERIADDTSRRTFLKATAATGVVAGVGGLAAAQETVNSFELGGRRAGWQGRAPPSIEGQTNPTLNLEPGTQYEITWENLDGQPHNVVIEDAEGNNIVRSEIISEEGATQEVTFEASEEMAEYYCEVHPNSMRGEVRLGGGERTVTETPTEEPQVIPEGPTVGLQRVADGLTAPLGLEHAQEDADRRFIVDQTGQIYIHGPDGLQDEPFLDVQDRMVEVGSATDTGFDERGLLGLAFHPDFQNNGKFYVRYSAPLNEGDDGGMQTTTAGNETAAEGETTMAEETTTMVEGGETTTAGTKAAGGETTAAGEGETTTAEGGQTTTADGETGDISDYDHMFVLSEFQANEDLSAGDPESERVLLEIPEPQFNHNAGAIAFGPDDYLYVTVGDGGDADDTGLGHVSDWYDQNEGGNGQDVEQNLLGSILRIDVDNQEGDKEYAIPDDNPLVDGEGLPEHYAWGFRNPWRMSFDSQGRLFVADVGQNLYEEVDMVEMGGNYGWNVKEGTSCFNTEDPNQPLDQCPDSTASDVRGGEELLDPILEYPHSVDDQTIGISITGGHVYEADTVSELQGAYVFGDWSQSFARPAGRIFIGVPPENGQQGGTETTTAGNETTGNQTTANQTAGGTETTTAGGGEETDPSAWEMQSLVISDSETGGIGRYVLSFGQDRNGDVYVLTNTKFTSGNTGEVYRIVPEGEGDQIEAPQMTTTTEAGETTTGEGDEATEPPEDETTTEMDAEETTEEVAAGETPSTGQPGFGVLAALGGVASAAGYLLTRDEDEE